jgi:hypothetical protein
MGSPEKRLAAVLGLMNQQNAVITDNCAHSNELAIQVKTLQAELKRKSNTKMPPFVSPPEEGKSPIPSCILRPTAAMKCPETYTYMKWLTTWRVIRHTNVIIFPRFS